MTRFLIITSILASGALLTACGSSGNSTAATDSSKRAGEIAFANCIRSHGVPNFPDPTSNGHGGIQLQQSDGGGSGPVTKVNGVAVNGPAFQQAMQACRRYEPNGGHPSAAQTAQLKAKALAMARCMRSHGVPNFPDPQFTTSGGGFGIRIGGPGMNPNSPTFQAAQRACGGIFGGDKSAGPKAAAP